MADEETHFETTSLNTVKRYKHRAVYEKKIIYNIVRSAPVLHVAFVDAHGLPQCIPMVGALEETDDGEAFVYLHGASVSRFIKTNDEGGEAKGLAGGDGLLTWAICSISGRPVARCSIAPMTIVATFVDGYILSLTPYSHDVQYRTAILHGSTFPFSSSYDGDVEAARLAALIKITNAIVPERYEQTRVPPTSAELKSTGVLRFRIESASAKINAAGASDNASDMANEDLKANTWTGVIPIKTIALDPEASEYNSLVGPKVPANVRSFVKAWEERMKAGLPES